MHSTATPLVERILVPGKQNGASLPYLFIILISLSAISALERSTEFTAAVAEAMTRRNVVYWNPNGRSSGGRDKE